jgi:hypothetical protein
MVWGIGGLLSGADYITSGRKKKINAEGTEDTEFTEKNGTE